MDDEQAKARTRLRRVLTSGGEAYPIPSENSGTGMTLRDLAALEFAKAQITFAGIDGCEKSNLAATAYLYADAFVKERERWH